MRRYRQSIWGNTFFGFALPITSGILSSLICCMFFSAVTLYIFGAVMFMKFFTLASLVVGGAVSGYICGRYRRRRGLLDGVICGLVFYAVIMLISLMIGEFTDVTKLLVLTVSGAAGGVSGVNSKRPKNLM